MKLFASTFKTHDKFECKEDVSGNLSKVRVVSFSFQKFIINIVSLGFPEGLAVVSVVGFFIEEGKSNVILLNWQHLAAHVYPSFVNSYLNWAAPNAIKVS